MGKLKFFVIFLVSVLVFSFVFLYANNYLDALSAKSVSDELNEAELGKNNVVERLVDHELLFLLVGVDEMKAETGDAVRSDTLILVKVDTKSGAVEMISIPRDTRCYVNGELTKINHAHAYGGITLTMKTIRQFLDIDLDYFIRADFKAVIEIVDAMGGIELDVPFELSEGTDGVNLYPGKQKVNGKQALAFVRNRRTYVDGDLGRVKAQQYFMKELVKQMLSPKNLTKIPAFIETYIKRVDTNIPVGMLLEMVPAAQRFSGDTVTGYRIPGTDGYEDGISYYFPDSDETIKLIEKLLPKYILSPEEAQREDAEMFPDRGDDGE